MASSSNEKEANPTAQTQDVEMSDNPNNNQGSSSSSTTNTTINNEINITVKNIEDETFPLTISPSATVAQLKLRIQQQTSHAPELQRLIFRGRVLKDDKTLADYGIIQNGVIHMVVRSPDVAEQNGTRNDEPNIPRSRPGQANFGFGVQGAMRNLGNGVIAGAVPLTLPPTDQGPEALRAYIERVMSNFGDLNSIRLTFVGNNGTGHVVDMNNMPALLSFIQRNGAIGIDGEYLATPTTSRPAANSRSTSNLRSALTSSQTTRITDSNMVNAVHRCRVFSTAIQAFLNLPDGVPITSENLQLPPLEDVTFLNTDTQVDGQLFDETIRDALIPIFRQNIAFHHRLADIMEELVGYYENFANLTPTERERAQRLATIYSNISYRMSPLEGLVLPFVNGTRFVNASEGPVMFRMASSRTATPWDRPGSGGATRSNSATTTASTSSTTTRSAATGNATTGNTPRTTTSTTTTQSTGILPGADPASTLANMILGALNNIAGGSSSSSSSTTAANTAANPATTTTSSSNTNTPTSNAPFVAQAVPVNPTSAPTNDDTPMTESLGGIAELVSDAIARQLSAGMDFGGFGMNIGGGIGVLPISISVPASAVMGGNGNAPTGTASASAAATPSTTNTTQPRAAPTPSSTTTPNDSEMSISEAMNGIVDLVFGTIAQSNSDVNIIPIPMELRRPIDSRRARQTDGAAASTASGSGSGTARPATGAATSTSTNRSANANAPANNTSNSAASQGRSHELPVSLIITDPLVSTTISAREQNNQQRQRQQPQQQRNAQNAGRPRGFNIRFSSTPFRPGSNPMQPIPQPASRTGVNNAIPQPASRTGVNNAIPVATPQPASRSGINNAIPVAPPSNEPGIVQPNLPRFGPQQQQQQTLPHTHTHVHPHHHHAHAHTHAHAHAHAHSHGHNHNHPIARARAEAQAFHTQTQQQRQQRQQHQHHHHHHPHVHNHPHGQPQPHQHSHRHEHDDDLPPPLICAHEDLPPPLIPAHDDSLPPPLIPASSPLDLPNLLHVPLGRAPVAPTPTPAPRPALRRTARPAASTAPRPTPATTTTTTTPSSDSFNTTSIARRSDDDVTNHSLHYSSIRARHALASTIRALELYQHSDEVEEEEEPSAHFLFFRDDDNSSSLRRGSLLHLLSEITESITLSNFRRVLEGNYELLNSIYPALNRVIREVAFLNGNPVLNDQALTEIARVWLSELFGPANWENMMGEVDAQLEPFQDEPHDLNFTQGNELRNALLTNLLPILKRFLAFCVEVRPGQERTVRNFVPRFSEFIDEMFLAWFRSSVNVFRYQFNLREVSRNAFDFIANVTTAMIRGLVIPIHERYSSFTVLTAEMPVWRTLTPLLPSFDEVNANRFDRSRNTGSSSSSSSSRQTTTASRPTNASSPSQPSVAKKRKIDATQSPQNRQQQNGSSSSGSRPLNVMQSDSSSSVTTSANSTSEEQNGPVPMDETGLDEALENGLSAEFGKMLEDSK